MINVKSTLYCYCSLFWSRKMLPRYKSSDFTSHYLATEIIHRVEATIVSRVLNRSDSPIEKEKKRIQKWKRKRHDPNKKPKLPGQCWYFIGIEMNNRNWTNHLCNGWSRRVIFWHCFRRLRLQDLNSGFSHFWRNVHKRKHNAN